MSEAVNGVVLPGPLRWRDRLCVHCGQYSGWVDGDRREAAVRVIVAEGSTLSREGLARLLAEEGYGIVAAVGDADALLDAVACDPPDVVVTNVRMPSKHTEKHTDDGLRTALRIRRQWPDVGVLVLSEYVDKRHIAALVGDGGRVGYLLEDRVTRVDLVEALDRVAAGDVVFDPEAVRGLLASTTRADPVGSLTSRERDILEKMAEGHTNFSIAAQLHISRSAVEKRVNAIFDKLAVTHAPGYSRRILAIMRYLESNSRNIA